MIIKTVNAEGKSRVLIETVNAEGKSRVLIETVNTRWKSQRLFKNGMLNGKVKGYLGTEC
ncbi:MAG: hypothetical protein ATN32_09185 [Candidatus Epulonipiscium fishelsonii]|nr:MAG: hypothetical protein ATN32_09185 [Epulopiscium sp. AS2M-Bin002]